MTCWRPQRGEPTVRCVDVGPPLLGGGRQPGALLLGLLQSGASGVASGGGRPFLLSGRGDLSLDVGYHRPIPGGVAVMLAGWWGRSASSA